MQPRAERSTLPLETGRETGSAVCREENSRLARFCKESRIYGSSYISIPRPARGRACRRSPWDTAPLYLTSLRLISSLHAPSLTALSPPDSVAARRTLEFDIWPRQRNKDGLRRLFRGRFFLGSSFNSANLVSPSPFARACSLKIARKRRFEATTLLRASVHR